jgi:hypothetical protein
MAFLASYMFLAVGLLTLFEGLTGYYFPKLFVVHKFAEEIMGEPLGKSDWGDVQKDEYRLKAARRSLRLGLLLIGLWTVARIVH